MGSGLYLALENRFNSRPTVKHAPSSDASNRRKIRRFFCWTSERIRAVADRVAASHRAGDDLVVVLSAMAGETNRLLELARDIDPEADARETDVLISTGEQVRSEEHTSELQSQ